QRQERRGHGQRPYGRVEPRRHRRHPARRGGARVRAEREGQGQARSPEVIDVEPLLGIPLGLALSTAAGLRVFVPLLLTGLAARLGYLTLTPSMTWIGSDAALLAFATATVLEVGAYYVPWLDNVLDTVGTPAAITAGAHTPTGA